MKLTCWSKHELYKILFATDEEMIAFMNYSRLVDDTVFVNHKMETVKNAYLVLDHEYQTIKEFIKLFGGIDET